jgi:hypothetical protein
MSKYRHEHSPTKMVVLIALFVGVAIALPLIKWPGAIFAILTCFIVARW